MKTAGLLLALLGGLVFATFSLGAWLEWPRHRPGGEFLLWWIGSGVATAVGVLLHLLRPRTARPRPDPASGLPLTRADWLRLRGRAAPAQVPEATSAPSPLPTPVPAPRRSLSPLAIVAIIVVVGVAGPFLFRYGLVALFKPLHALGVPAKVKPFLVLAVVLVPVVFLHYRNTGRRLDAREVGWLAGQALRWAVALALFSAPYFLAGWILSGTVSDPKSRETVGLLSIVFAPVILIVMALLGLPLAWAFLALTREHRRRTIGEIARENEARDRGR